MKYLFLVGLLAADVLAPRIYLEPRVLLAGGTVHLRCSVPRHENNRWLDFGVDSYRISRDELPGDAAPITHEIFIEHVPCDVGPAFCAVTDAAGKVRKVTASYEMAGCD